MNLKCPLCKSKSVKLVSFVKHHRRHGAASKCYQHGTLKCIKEGCSYVDLLGGVF